MSFPIGDPLLGVKAYKVQVINEAADKTQVTVGLLGLAWYIDPHNGLFQSSQMYDYD